MSTKDTTARAQPETTELRNPRGIYKGTREEWLEEAMGIMAPWLNTALAGPRIDAKGQVVPMKSKSIGHKRALNSNGPNMKPTPASFKFRLNEVRVSCSLLSAGMNNGRAIAHVHLKHATGNGYHEIRMGAHLGGRKTRESSSQVADILLHEMIHTMFPYDGHKLGFRWMCEAMGLKSPMTATTASPALAERIDNNIVKILGKYPHKGVKLVPRGKRGIGSRSIKCECHDCGCIIRLTQKWLDIAGDCVHCPVGGDGHDFMIIGGV